MATLADSLKSSTERPLNLRKRPDLVASHEKYQGRSYWIIKDPVGLNYFRFQEEEYFILNLLDGETSLDDIKAEFEAEFPPQKIRFEELGHFLGTLHRTGLVLSDAPGQAKHLLERFHKRRNSELVQKLANILCLRFKGWNPERVLVWLDRHVGWIYSRWCVALCLMFALSALLLVIVNFHQFQLKLPSFHQFFTPANAFWLAVVLAVTKIIHEFGHGLTCKHFGGECHEMGIMFLVLTPCLYCNVSDSWMLPNKWHRIYIGIGGMYVEMVIASAATWIWWYSSEGLIHNLCLSTMFVCSVSTLIFNGNPLLRYDGYYILSDILEIPNLGQKSNTILSRYAGYVCLGLEMQEDPFLPRQHRELFALYAVASFCYRWVVVLSILLFMNAFFRPYRLEVIGRMLGMMSLYGLFVMPMWKLGKFFWVPGRTDLVKKVNLYTSLGVIAALFLAICYIPLPHRVLGTFVIEPHEAQSVYVEVPGMLRQTHVKPGDMVRAGQEIASLTSYEVELGIHQLETQRADYETRLQMITREAAMGKSSEAMLRVPEVSKALESTEEMLKRKRVDRERLTIRAPKDGMLLPPPEIPPKPPSQGELPTWTGTPFTPRNVGCYLTESTLLCRIGASGEMEAHMLVEQSDIMFIREGQSVDLQLDELPGQIFHGKVHEISRVDAKSTHPNLTNKSGGEVATKTDDSGAERPLTVSYQVRIYPLEGPPELLRIGFRGRSKVYVPWESLGSRVWRWFQQTFHFRL